MNSYPPAVNVSIIIPVYNEEANVVELHKQICATINPMDRNFEIIFVDDGSTDKTAEYLESLRGEDPRLNLIQLKKNHGQIAAFLIGCQGAKGDIIISMDGDLQNDPADIPRFVEKIDEGFDLVSGWRYPRRDPLNRRLISALFNHLMWIKTGIKLRDCGCFFVAATKRLIDRKLREQGNETKFIKSSLVGLADTVVEIKIDHRARQAGASKYRLMRIIKLGVSLVCTRGAGQRRWNNQRGKVVRICG